MNSSQHTNSGGDPQPLTVGPLRDDLSFDHGAVSGFNAWFFTAFAGYINHIARRHKQAAFTGTSAGSVVEIGAGTGANICYLEPGTHLYAIEPSLRMHDRLRQRCASAGIELTILPTGAEAIPLPDASVDEVICSLVLCTVTDPELVLSEIRRILRPGGRFRFIEHVAAPHSSLRARVQRSIRRPWGWLFEGCDTHRHTPETIRGAGFASVSIEERKFRNSLFWPVNTAVWGVAVR
ncbi:class I SAM-dependent methyltransferase [Salinactinospora qingdaonensis]|uniref:Methyltransferase type 11 domain-containing protein n=1 Tax=Salinactinospora qingdaonensis TaxID=702744 RepID=A0ABP7FC32_9ACTN